MKIVIEKKVEDLVKDGVIVATQEVLVREGEEPQKIGDIVRTSYGNWPSDRIRLTENESPDVVAAVMGMWGDEPTLEDPADADLQP